MQSNLLLGAAALSGVAVLGHTQMGLEIMPPIKREQRNLRALRGIWYQGSAWFLFTGLQLLRWSQQGIPPSGSVDRYSYLLVNVIDAFYTLFYIRLGYRPPLLAYGGRLACMLTALRISATAAA